MIRRLPPSVSRDCAVPLPGPGAASLCPCCSLPRVCYRSLTWSRLWWVFPSADLEQLS